MDLDHLQQNWDALGRQDPMWAILSDPTRRGNKWDVEEFFRTGREHVAEALAHLDRLGVRPAGGRALDFGCGVGRLTQALADHFEQADGVDIAPSMIDGARDANQHGDRVQYHLNDRDDLSIFDDDSFDLVLSLIVLQHIENRYKARYLAEFLRILRPDGIALFTVPSHVALTPLGVVLGLVPNRWLNAARKRVYGYDGVMELHGMRREEVEAVVRSAGGDVVDVEPEPLAGEAWHSYRYTVRKR